jgi:subtilisin family serine protease
MSRARVGRRWPLAALALATLAATLIGPFGHTPAGAAPTPQRVSQGPASVVTLITGDVVEVTQIGDGHYTTDVRRPRGAIGGVHVQTIGKDLYVLPDEVMPYLAAGKLDRRLFDVSGLIRQGYDDRHSDGIALIVSYADGAAAQKPVPVGATKIRSLPSVHGSAVKANKRQARQVWDAVTPHATVPVTTPVLAQGMTKIWLDGKVHVDLSESTAQVGAPAAWTAGLDGTGVKVAVLDTGVDLSHPDLAGRVSAMKSFVPNQTVDDGHGHGTHVASTVGGSGDASGGLEKGVAPKADLIIGKILGNEGFGDDSWVIAGMEWAAAQGARVISMSIGGDQPSDGTDPLSSAVNQLTAQSGALFVIAAGNSGSEASITGPGAADAALTVAAVDSSDQLADFSSTGPRYGDYSLKPDIAAPGVAILAAKAGGNAADGYYQTMSGTSMATPHVSGAAAILAQQHPSWHAAELKNALMSTSKRLTDYTAYQVGAGRVDIEAGINASVTATGSVYFGFQGWPHANSAPIDRSVTYANTGEAPVTLHLTVTGVVAGGPYDADPHAGQGTAAPGMFTLSAGTVVIAAHTTASVTATAHPALGADGRRYLGEVTATADGAPAVHTNLGMYVEEERHDLTLSVKNRAGQYVATTLVLQRFGEVDPYYLSTSDSGPTTVRLRPGTYSAFTYLDVPGLHGAESMGVALLGDPEVVLDQDRNVTLDARQAREVTAAVPKRTEDRILIMDWYRTDGADSTIGDQYLLPPWVDTMFALATKQVTRGAFEYETRWRKAYPLLTITDRGRDVPFLGQPGSTRYANKLQTNALYLGTGAPEDYAGQDVRGRAVLVTRSDQLTGQQRAQAAAAAGAEMLIVVNDSPAKLIEWVGNDDLSLSPITVVSVTSTTGAPLIDQARRGQLRLGLEGVPDSPYVYDLVDPHPGRIPADLAYKPRPGDFAIVDMRFHGDEPIAGGEFRADYRPYRTYGAGFPLWQDMPGTRTDYLSITPGTTWSESAIGGHELELVSISDRHAYAPGSRTTVDFFGPIVRPRNNPPFWSSFRADGWMSFNVQPWADGNAGHAGFMQWGDQLTFTVFQDGVEVKKTEGWASATIEDNPSGTTHFTLDLQAGRDPAHYRLSPRTHTVWEVVSQPVAHPEDLDLMPLLQLDYAVVTDMAGNAPGGPQHLGLTPSHLAGAVGAGQLTGAALEVSFDDGVTWRNVTLTREGGTWVAGFIAPTTGFVSLRATASDSAGNKITQEIIRAYGLRTPGSR